MLMKKRIRNYHLTKNKKTGTPQRYKRGKVPSRAVSNYIKHSVRKHIQSIPRIDSHFCRKSTNKEYIQENLNMTILYEKYCGKCVSDNVIPAKKSMYRSIFNTEFNIEVHRLKKDRCDKCESMTMNPSPNSYEKMEYEIQIKNKAETNEERNHDRLDKSKCVICFDMENVFSLPTANISNFFYKQKLTVFHLTAQCSISKKNYSAVWSELTSG